MTHIVVIAYLLMFAGACILAGLSMKRRRPFALISIVACSLIIVVPLVALLVVYLMPQKPEVGGEVLSPYLADAGRLVRISLAVLIPATFIASIAVFTGARIEVGSSGSRFE